jgi:predicted transcriptional regulator
MTEEKVRNIRKTSFAWFEKEIFELGLSVHAIAVYMVLVRYSDHDSQKCFPGLQKIAEKLNCSKNTIIKAIKELEKSKAIQVQRSPVKDGKTTNVYLMVSLPEVVQDVNQGSAGDALGVVQDVDSINNQYYQQSINNLPPFSLSGEKPVEKVSKSKPKPVKETDPRQHLFIKGLQSYWNHFNDETLKMPFAKRMPAVLGDLLKANPHLSIEDFIQCLRNRADSQGIIPTEDPVSWVSSLLKYHAGPLDKFGKPITKGRVA